MVYFGTILQVLLVFLTARHNSGLLPQLPAAKQDVAKVKLFLQQVAKSMGGSRPDVQFNQPQIYLPGKYLTTPHVPVLESHQSTPPQEVNLVRRQENVIPNSVPQEANDIPNPVPQEVNLIPNPVPQEVNLISNQVPQEVNLSPNPVPQEVDLIPNPVQQEVNLIPNTAPQAMNFLPSPVLQRMNPIPHPAQGLHLIPNPALQRTNLFPNQEMQGVNRNSNPASQGINIILNPALHDGYLAPNQTLQQMLGVKIMPVTADAHEAFGHFVATELKKYDPQTLAFVKQAIGNILFRADTKTDITGRKLKF